MPFGDLLAWLLTHGLPMLGLRADEALSDHFIPSDSIVVEDDDLEGHALEDVLGRSQLTSMLSQDGRDVEGEGLVKDRLRRLLLYVSFLFRDSLAVQKKVDTGVTV